MSRAQQFMTFLVDQMESKVGEIKKHPGGENTKAVVEEVAVYVRKMRDVIPMAFDSTKPVGMKRTPVRRRRSEANSSD